MRNECNKLANQTTTTTTTQQQTNYFKIPGIILGTVLYYNKPKK